MNPITTNGEAEVRGFFDLDSDEDVIPIIYWDRRTVAASDLAYTLRPTIEAICFLIVGFCFGIRDIFSVVNDDGERINLNRAVQIVRSFMELMLLGKVVLSIMDYFGVTRRV